jgi:hypothetical protein
LVTTPLNFQNGALHSTIDYPVGFGLENASQLYCLLKKSILVNTDNPVITFDEIALLDPNDHMIVEASKDEGQNWIALTEKYNSQSQAGWTGPWLNNKKADSTMYRQRTIQLTDFGDIEDGDKLLIRFKLYTNKTISGWGWAMDNLKIQSPVTSIESPDLENFFSISPNPANHTLALKVERPLTDPMHVSIIDMNGKIVTLLNMDNPGETAEQNLQVSDWPSGMYILRATVGPAVRYVKVIILH